MILRSFKDNDLKALSKTVFRWWPELPDKPIIISATPRTAPCLTLRTLSKHSLIRGGNIFSTISFGLKTEITERAYDAISRIAGSQCLSCTKAKWLSIASRYSGYYATKQDTLMYALTLLLKVK